MKPKSPEQAAWEAECKRLLKKITRTSCDEKAKRLQDQYRLHVGLRPKPFLPGLREFGDTTTAAFLEGLASSGGTAIVIADEGGTVTGGLTLANLAIWNKGWDGTTLNHDRLSSGSIVVENPRVVVFLAIQPEPFRRFFERNHYMARESGFACRAVWAYAESTQGYRGVGGHSPNRSYSAVRRFQRLRHEGETRSNEILRNPDATRQLLRLTAGATRLRQRFAAEMELSLRPDGAYADVRDQASKAVEIATRMAGVMHCFFQLDGDIDEGTMHDAISLMRWHLEEYRRLFGEPNQYSHAFEDAMRLQNFLVEQINAHGWFRMSSFPRSQLRTYGPNASRLPKRFDAAIDYLVRQGALTEERVKGGARIQLVREYFRPLVHPYSMAQNEPQVLSVSNGLGFQQPGHLGLLTGFRPSF
jgi:hypothetical protein